MSPRYFTLQEATNELQWLSDRLKEINELLFKLEHLKDTSETLTTNPDPDGLQTEAERVNRKVRAILLSVAQKGIILRDPSTGLSDFPSKNIDGREIYLCWKSGEESIAFWHTPESGFAGREPL